MNSVRSYSRIVLLCVVVLVGGGGARAQDLQVSPNAWDFGNVAVGTSAMMTFDLRGGDPSPVWVYFAFLNETPDENDPLVSPYFGEWSLGAFSFNPATWPTLPLEMPPGDHISIDVIFTPLLVGDFQVYLGILSNDSIGGPGPQAFYLLEGRGVSGTVPEPGTLALLGLGFAGLAFSRRKRQLQ